MEPESVPKQLKEKSEKHYCVRCLKETARDEYLENDFLCDSCFEADQKAKGMRDEG